MTTTQTVEEILRPLAEHTVLAISSPNMEQHPIPDPRFEALRLPHISHTGQGGPWDYMSCQEVGCSGHDSPGMDASLGAIVRAAAACGLAVFIVSLEEVRLVRREEVQMPWQKAWYGFGATPEEATARALVVAWEKP